MTSQGAIRGAGPLMIDTVENIQIAGNATVPVQQALEHQMVELIFTLDGWTPEEKTRGRHNQLNFIHSESLDITIGINAGFVVVAFLSKVETARQRGYCFYVLGKSAGRAEDARAYNELITSLTVIESVAAKQPALKRGEQF